jgi:RNA polymerase sigma-70 factor, ECF subfamily
MVAAASHSRSVLSPSSGIDPTGRVPDGRAATLYDAALVRRFTAGDDAAFDEIIARYRGRIAAYSFKVLRSHADAEEIAQDTFIKAHRHLHRFRGDCSLSTWLHTVALNLSRNRYWHRYRRRHHVTQSLDCAINDRNPATLADLAASDAPGPVEEAAAREFTDLAATCIAKLSSVHRIILERRIVQNCSYDDIAGALGISVGTVKSRIARAREKLRALMTGACPEVAPNPASAVWFDPVRSFGSIRLA